MKDNEWTEAKATRGNFEKNSPLSNSRIARFSSVAVFFFFFFFFPYFSRISRKYQRAANTIVAGGGYISSVKRKACSKLNFPRRGRLAGVDATAERDPVASRRGGRCIAVGGLAIELRSDRCTPPYISSYMKLLVPSPSIGQPALAGSRFFRSAQIMQRHLTECSHAAR